MKKTILKGLAIAACAIFTSSAFAEMGPNVEVSVQSIEEGLQARSIALQHNAVGLGADDTTFILVVNYTKESIKVLFPDGKRTLTYTTSAKYKRLNYTGKTHIELATVNDEVVWKKDVGYQDIISVYGAYPNYTIYDTP